MPARQQEDLDLLRNIQWLVLIDTNDRIGNVFMDQEECKNEI